MTKPWQIFAKWSIVGSLGLATFYLLLSTLLSGSISHSFDQFVSLQPWISFLILSFGVQIGLFQLVRKGLSLVEGTSTVSGVSMLLCCVHHVSDFLPILGVSTLGLVLTAYQKDFLIIGVLMNVFGIFYMARLLHFTNKPIFKYLLLLSVGSVMAFSVLAITMDMYTKMTAPTGVSAKTNALEAETKQVGVVEVKVTPKQLNHGQEMIFTISLNNHSIDLNYDYAKIAVVVDDGGKIYRPLSWTGRGGGHHVSGDLIFDKLDKRVAHIGLNITGVDGKNVDFDWEL